MSVLRQQNWLGQQRIDVPHLRSVESSIAADFDLLAGQVLAGKEPLVVKGFVLLSATALNGPATSLVMVTAGGVILHPTASESGTIFAVPETQESEILNSINSRVDGSFTPGTTNYIGLDLRRQADSSTSDLVAFLDANTLEESSKTVPLARTLDYRIVISTADFSATPNLLPIAKVTTNENNNVDSIEDARPMLFRLAQGGSTPNSTSSYSWLSRRENTTGDVFGGGDKEIGSFKEFADAVMTRLWELGGGEYWYRPTSDRDLKLAFGTPTLTSNKDNFEWTGTVLRWSGLSVLFGNSTAFYNNIADELSGIALADGECLYVDVDRSSAATLTPAVAPLTGLSTPAIPGSRVVIAWRRGSNIYVKDKAFEVGRTIPVASDTVWGTVSLSYAAGNTEYPKVAPLDVNGTISATATGGNASGFVGTGFGTGHGVRGTGGTSGGAGVQGTGGTTGSGVVGLGGSASGAGVVGTGTGGSSGVEGYGQGVGAGVSGTGGATGAGVVGVGGVSGGVGVSGVGRVNNAGVQGTGQGTGVGVKGIGGATGNGVVGEGGASGGIGLVGTGTVDNPGVSGIGHGTGAGITGVGGDTGSGVMGTGGSAGGTGVIGTGTGEYYGMEAFGSNSGAGIYATGGDTGDGVIGLGGSTSGIGVEGTGGGGNSVGVRGNGSGNASGVEGYGGIGGGTGVKGFGHGASAGVTGKGGATGAGLRGDGGDTSGVGVVGVGGPNSAGGQFSAGAGSSIGLVVSTGDAKVESGNVSVSADFKYATARSGRVFHIQPSKMRVVNGNGGDDKGKLQLVNQSNWGDWLFTPRVPGYSRIELTAPVNLPHGANITSLRARYTTDVVSVNENTLGIELYLTRTTSSGVGVIWGSNPRFRITSIGGDVADTFSFSHTVDNSSSSQYQLNLALLANNYRYSWSDLPGKRNNSEAVSLDNGLILVTGGMDSGGIAQNTAYWFEPNTEKLTQKANMPSARAYHGAVKNYDGRVFIFGGSNSGGAVTNIWIYDPSSDSYTTRTASLDRWLFACSPIPFHGTLGPAGLIGGAILTGGRTTSVSSSLSTVYAIVDDSAPVVSLASMNTARQSHAQSYIMDNSGLNKLLVTGGSIGAAASTTNSAEAFTFGIPGSWSSVTSMATAREFHTQTTLPNGLVLVAGGNTTSNNSATATTSCELYDPVSNTWSAAASMPQARTQHRAFLLENGKVLVCGGRGAADLVFGCVYDPGTNTWTNATYSPANIQVGNEYSPSKCIVMAPNNKIIRFGNINSVAAGGAHIHVVEPDSLSIRRAAQFPSINFYGLEIVYDLTNVVSEF